MDYHTQVETILALPIGAAVLALAIAALILLTVLAMLTAERRSASRVDHDE